MPARQARRYTVRGRVQGVGFRYHVERKASRLGCTGYVRNLSDGAVEVFAMGTPAQLEELHRDLWLGPPLSQVDAVDAKDAQPEASDGFQVRF